MDEISVSHDSCRNVDSKFEFRNLLQIISNWSKSESRSLSMILILFFISVWNESFEKRALSFYVVTFSHRRMAGFFLQRKNSVNDHKFGSKVSVHVFVVHSTWNDPSANISPMSTFMTHDGLFFFGWIWINRAIINIVIMLKTKAVFIQLSRTNVDELLFFCSFFEMKRKKISECAFQSSVVQWSNNYSQHFAVRERIFLTVLNW